MITSLEPGGIGFYCSGTLETDPPPAQDPPTYRIQLFACDTCDPSGAGEGQRFLAETEISVDAGGFGSFVIELSEEVREERFLTATAIKILSTLPSLEPYGDTSEFSECFEVVR